MVTTDDDEIAARLRLVRNQGEEVRYRTDTLGANYRMTEVAAALGAVQLSKLDEWNQRRRANAAWLSQHLAGVVTPTEEPDARHVYHLYTVRVPAERRDAVVTFLRERGIEAGVYYPLCIHQQPLYIERGIGGSFPVAEQAVREIISLPVHPGLSQEDLEQIASAVNEALTPTQVRHG
jgi:dTDP-4-amino-4,6-dideoxygalactose transaminase